jgi:hypothetical protein
MGVSLFILEKKHLSAENNTFAQVFLKSIYIRNLRALKAGNFHVEGKGKRRA